MGAPRKAWTRDELLVAFRLYCRTPFGKLHQANPDIVDLANQLERTPGSVAMKLVNLANLDPVQQARGITGLKNVSQADRALFTEFQEDWPTLAVESERAMRRLAIRECGDAEEVDFAQTAETEAVRSVRVRRLQSLFRATVLAGYDNRCAISGIDIPSLLQASHIIPWSEAEDRRIDPRNGVALSALHDRAFDRGLITIADDLRVVLSSKLRDGEPSEIHRVALIEIEGRELRLPSRYAPDPEALAYHRQHVFVA